LADVTADDLGHVVAEQLRDAGTRGVNEAALVDHHDRIGEPLEQHAHVHLCGRAALAGRLSR